MGNTVSVEGLEVVGTSEAVGGGSGAGGTLGITGVADSSSGELSCRAFCLALAIDHHSRALGEAVLVEEELVAGTGGAGSGSTRALHALGVADQAAAVCKVGAVWTLIEALSVEVDLGVDTAVAVVCRASAGGAGEGAAVTHSFEGEGACRALRSAGTSIQLVVVLALGAPDQTLTGHAPWGTWLTLACILEGAFQAVEFTLAAISHIPGDTSLAAGPVHALRTVGQAGHALVGGSLIGHGGTVALLVGRIVHEGLDTRIATVGGSGASHALLGTGLAVEDAGTLHQQLVGHAGTGPIPIGHAVGCTLFAGQLVVG